MLKVILVSLFALVAVGLAAVAVRDLPKGWPRCKRFDPKLSECLLKATDQVRPFLMKGVPELGIPKVEPFNISEIVLEQGTSALNFKAKLTDIIVHGLSNYKFTQFDFDVPNLQWFCKANMDKLTLEGDYTVTGKILLAPIEGKGKFTAGIDNSQIFVHQIVKPVIRNGWEYLKPTLTNTTMLVGGPKVKLDGLFGGNADLNRVTNQVISDNVNELFEDLRPVIEKVVSNIVEQWLFKALEDNIPFDKLYPKE